MTPDIYIEKLAMKPHPEGGWYAEVWRDAPPDVRPRGTGSSIYYLLQAGERSHWHTVDAVEIWHYYAGDGLRLGISEDGDTAPDWHALGPDLTRGERPQIVVPEGYWQSAEARAGWCLVGCTVTPAFEFSGFTLAPEGWAPGDL